MALVRLPLRPWLAVRPVLDCLQTVVWCLHWRQLLRYCWLSTHLTAFPFCLCRLHSWSQQRARGTCQMTVRLPWHRLHLRRSLPFWPMRQRRAAIVRLSSSIRRWCRQKQHHWPSCQRQVDHYSPLLSFVLYQILLRPSGPWHLQEQVLLAIPEVALPEPADSGRRLCYRRRRLFLSLRLYPCYLHWLQYQKMFPWWC